MNYKIAIVDDEPNLVEGLHDQLKNILPPETEVLRAYSAGEFCDLLLRTPVDLVISDICMPGVTGIEMLSRVEQLCPHCAVIFLTGYDTFSWVQEAVRHPCCVDYLLKTAGDDAILASVKKQLNYISEQTQPQVLLQRLSAQQAAVQSLIHREALGQWLTKGGEIPERYLAALEDDDLLICLCRRTEVGPSGSAFSTLLRNALLDGMSICSEVDVVPAGWEQYACLCRMGENDIDEERIAPFIHTRLESVQSSLSSLGEQVCFAYQAGCCSAAHAPQAFAKLQDILNAAPKGQNLLLGDKPHQPTYLKNETTLLKWIEQYVAEHLSDHNLSLTVIAAKTYYSPGYLSKLFRKQSGMNLTDYIAQVRIDTACRLLRETNHSVRDIGQSIGFESPSYFGIIFKRRLGQTPAEYRRDMSGR